MIMIIIDIYFFRGSPTEPAGPSSNKPLHVRGAEARRKVHYKMLAKIITRKNSVDHSKSDWGLYKTKKHLGTNHQKLP